MADVSSHRPSTPTAAHIEAAKHASEEILIDGTAAAPIEARFGELLGGGLARAASINTPQYYREAAGGRFAPFTRPRRPRHIIGYLIMASSEIFYVMAS